MLWPWPARPRMRTASTINRFAISINSFREHTSLAVKFDDQDALIPPCTRSRALIAIYCGWYSLHHYRAAGGHCSCRGAVGFRDVSEL